MKILLLRNPSSAFECKLTEGQSGDVDAALAQRLIDAGIAVPADIKAVPESATVKAEESAPATESTISKKSGK